METQKSLTCKVLVYLLKNPQPSHTLTAIANNLSASRVGVWKTAKKLQANDLINLTAVGQGKTNIQLININWNSPVVDKLLAVYLAQESLDKQEWLSQLSSTKDMLDLLILYEKNPNETDLIHISPHKRKFVRVQQAPKQIQGAENMKINTLNFTDLEFVQELSKKNTAFVNAVQKGVVLFGQEKFIQIIKQLGI